MDFTQIALIAFASMIGILFLLLLVFRVLRLVVFQWGSILSLGVFEASLIYFIISGYSEFISATLIVSALFVFISWRQDEEAVDTFNQTLDMMKSFLS